MERRGENRDEVKRKKCLLSQFKIFLMIKKIIAIERRGTEE